MLGSANLTGGRLFHILSGNLSHQIEHHLFPDIPAHRYAELAVEVREICERYGVPYNAGPLGKQFGSVVKKIFRLAVPRNTHPAAAPPAAAGEPEPRVQSPSESTLGSARGASERDLNPLASPSPDPELVLA
jgi:fatty acid desaturase